MTGSIQNQFFCALIFYNLFFKHLDCSITFNYISKKTLKKNDFFVLNVNSKLSYKSCM